MDCYSVLSLAGHCKQEDHNNYEIRIQIRKEGNKESTIEKMADKIIDIQVEAIICYSTFKRAANLSVKVTPFKVFMNAMRIFKI